MDRSGLIRALAIWLGASLAGAALIVVLPEQWLGRERLFSLNPQHGPTPSDAAGLILVLAGWAIWLRALWVRRREMPRGPAVLLVLVAITAATGCVAAIASGFDGWGIALGLAALCSQLTLGGLVWKRRSAPETNKRLP